MVTPWKKTNKGISRYSSDFLEKEKIGEGAFGLAFLCMHKLDEREYMVKMVPLNERDREKKLREVVALRKAQHENVVRYYQCWVEDCTLFSQTTSTLFIGMEYYTMTLNHKLVQNIEETEIIHLFKQLLKGLGHMHRNGIIHFNIKPDNLFIDQSNNLRIGGFGQATNSGESYIGNVGSSSCWDTHFRAPEMRRGSNNLTNAVDIFSAGVVLLEMISPSPDFIDKMSVFDDALLGLFPFGVSENISLMLGLCLNEDPTKRASAITILEMF